MNPFAFRPTAAAICLCAASAFAQTPSTPAVPPPVAVQPGAATMGAQPVPAARWTADQIRQAFDLADSDTDGQLSRAEAQRLTILPRSFEDMDQNKDGALSRREYEAGFAR
jgi:hypothetical protein